MGRLVHAAPEAVIEVLFEEAHRLRRRRRALWTTAAATTAAVVLAVVVGTASNGLGGAHRGALPAPGGTVSPRLVASSTGQVCGDAGSLVSGGTAHPEGHQPDPGGIPNPSTVTASIQLDHALQARFPEQYAGSTLSDENAIITIYETCSSASMSRYVRSIAPAGSVQYRFFPNTLQDLHRAFTTAANDDTAWARKGMRLGGFGVDVYSNVLDVQIVDATPAQLTEVSNDLGPSRTDVESITPQQLGVPL